MKSVLVVSAVIAALLIVLTIAASKVRLWELKWFQDFIAWCRRWEWFDAKIYGKSEDLEDFVRNPAEVLRDTTFPFVIKNVDAYSIANLRIGYRHFTEKSPVNCWQVPMGNRK